MSQKIKLLNEINKCFKKVEEGFKIFEEIMEKLAKANSNNQRKKFEDDLKKEIKKLQRLRGQIRMWHSSRDIKDKDGLAKYRQLIEQRMELFKEIERKNKTKPYSKRGLAVEDEIDPKEKEKNEAIEWLNCRIRSLCEKIDKAESKLEILTTASEVTGCDHRKLSIYLNEEELKGHIEQPIEDYINGLDTDTDCILADLDSCLADIYEELDIASHIPQLAVHTSFLADDESQIEPESIQAQPDFTYIDPSAQNLAIVSQQLKPASSPVTIWSLVRNENEGLPQTPVKSAWYDVAASALPRSNETPFAEKRFVMARHIHFLCMLIRRYRMLSKRYPSNKKYAVYYFAFMNFLLTRLMNMAAAATAGSQTRDTVTMKVGNLFY
uniref:CCR4-Not complex component Not N-terminal domain-containing protein n=1 Tax=Ditylenchus dipsaci TaxID=166011 RepID=A0A915CRD7_9BILA